MILNVIFIIEMLIFLISLFCEICTPPVVIGCEIDKGYYNIGKSRLE